MAGSVRPYDDYQPTTGIVTCGPNEALVISGMCQVIFLILVRKLAATLAYSEVRK